jgi:urea transporter/murein DD-endopeptidase MepM/ murein hydrolase activator NlpD
LTAHLKTIAPREWFLAVLNSYGMLFFSRNKIFSVLILLVSFIVPYSGLMGLLGLITAIVGAHALGYDRKYIESGIYTYSPLLFGLGFGTNFEPGLAFYVLLVIGSMMALLISVMLTARLSQRGLPALSLGFIFSTWIIILASQHFSALGLNQRVVYWYNEAYALGGKTLVDLIQAVEEFPMPLWLAGFFRSLSGILFQVNIACGVLLAIGMLVYSRIGFLLLVVGYAIAIYFNHLMGGFSVGNMSYYNMGTNFMLVSLALGGFYLVPSVRSFLWLLVTVPIAYLLVVGLGALIFKFGIPAFSLPFCLVVILFLHAMQLRVHPGKLMLTPIQFYSPEKNLYRFANSQARLKGQSFPHLSLPILGEWMVSQGYEGSMTHRGEWGKALDFVLLDHELKTYQLPGNRVEHFYSYDKPVLAPADGVVQEVIDYVDDNPVGGNNAQQNWGNTIVIRHTDQVYTKLSHLQRGSILVHPGMAVKRGDWIARVGNSGRSPEPHLHFQVQTTPFIGSKTVAYPFAYFLQRGQSGEVLQEFTVPSEGSFVRNISLHAGLQQAFNFQPGMHFRIVGSDGETEQWEVMDTVYNELYLYCETSGAAAYFVRSDSAFYFTGYHGPRQGHLHTFYRSAYKVIFSVEKQVQVKDAFPLEELSWNPLRWIQDVVAPFFLFMRIEFRSVVLQDGGKMNEEPIILETSVSRWLSQQSKPIQQARITIQDGQINALEMESSHRKIKLTWHAAY